MPLAFTTGTSSHPKNTLQKRKFEIKVLLLVHVLIPGVMLSSLETINPWLSACDLKQQQQQHPGPADLGGSCSATRFPAGTTSPHEVDLLCPKECPPNESKTNASCLAYLDDARRSAICNFDLGNGIEWLKSFLGTIRLRHCCEYKIIESLSQSLLERVLRGKGECFRIIDSLVEVDNLAARITCEFSEILTRYDCQQPYSVKFSCHDCLEAYRRWVCSTLVPYYSESTRIRPCRSVCQSVEQKCPYFLPENKAPSLPTQYAGEPTFLCMDPNIPETGEQQKRSLYPDGNACCVKICGSLKDGLCVENGSSSSSSYNCKSERLASYEEALDQMADCGSEPFGSRAASLECTASEPYSSPHKLGSGAPRASPGPALFLSAYLNLFFRGPAGFRRCCCCSIAVFFLLVFNSHCSAAFPSWAKILACLPLAAAMADFRWRIGSLSRGRFYLRERKLFFLFLLIERSKLIFNYFKFNSNKWQYYFILISVNLSIRSFSEPFAVPPPSCSAAREGTGSGGCEKARGATNRHDDDGDDDEEDDDNYYYHLSYYLDYYYYYYYYYHERSRVYYYNTSRRIAQISKKNHYGLEKVT